MRKASPWAWSHAGGWLKVAALAIAVGVIIAGAGNGAIAASNCKKVAGKLTLTPVTGAECASPVGVCATGAYQGGALGGGSSSFIASAIIPTADTPTTGVVLITGDTVITATGGTLITKDAINSRTTGNGEFVELHTIVGGTGDWQGATGVMSVTGTFPASESGSAQFSGEICLP